MELDVRVAYKKITTIVVAPSTSRQQMVTTMSKLFHVSRKKLHKHTKFNVSIDEKNEDACWDFICRKPY